MRQRNSGDTFLSAKPSFLSGFRLGQNLSISLSCVFVGGNGILHLIFGNQAFLLRPALVDALETPFGAAARCSDWLFVDGDEDRVRVRRRKNTKGVPRALSSLYIESQVIE